jgi:hypothetical protein
MPTSPESQSRIIVDHASDHVLWRLNTVQHRPQSEEPPNNQEFEPDQDQVEETNHTDLKNRIIIPRLPSADRYHVHVVVGKLHREQSKQETTHPHGEDSDWECLWESQLRKQ